MNDQEPREPVDRIARLLGAIRDALAPAVDALTRMVRSVYEFVRTWRSHVIRAEWQWAQRSARMLSRHPDLVAMDGWMDRMYPGIP